MSGEFLFILPAGWEQIVPTDVDLIEGGLSTCRAHISGGQMGDLTALFIASGRFTAPTYIDEAKLLNDDILVVHTVT
jgi:hypothetical protein